MEKAFLLLTLPILNLHDINNSNDIQQMELQKVKECVMTYVLSSISSFSDKKETNVYSLWSKKERLSDNRSFVDTPTVTLGDGLKMIITGWSLLTRFSFGVIKPSDRRACVAQLVDKKSPME
ncbi:hypothetical protein AVEN_87100-1 [Araneus ventricosus]|uniref:Uncharacterized protein n=1 Tax=Araneus ventricosus TaxID=182803 RepID=A0A4Y2PCB7_ARAVE|nr:hypothetical protein AVEN_87100-1 [Araneus ventricosus]